MSSAPWAGRPNSASAAASGEQPQNKPQRPHSAVPKVQSQHTIDVSGLNLQEGDTTTTVAIGKDTYTIGIGNEYFITLYVSKKKECF